MKENISRRKLMEISAISGPITALGLAQSSETVEAEQVTSEPQADTIPDLFRLIDSGFDDDPTSVSVLDYDSKETITTINVDTTGTNHDKLEGMSHEDRFPFVAADIDSFGTLDPGRYICKVQHKDLTGEIEFYMREDGTLPDRNTIQARIKPDGRMVMYRTHPDPPVQH